ncbi:hypothetical protein [Clostridium tertium]|nr:hypothetical protein [Clostridium tertium]
MFERRELTKTLCIVVFSNFNRTYTSDKLQQMGFHTKSASFTKYSIPE